MNKRIIERFPIIVALSLIYFLAGKLGLALALVNPSVSAVWPPTGIALASFLIFGYDVWPAIFFGAFAVNLTTEGTAATSFGIATGNTLEGLLGAYLVSRYANGCQAFTRVNDVLRFAFLSGVVSTSIAATIGVFSLSAGGLIQAEADRMQAWLTWWLGDMIGAIVLAPCLILWSIRPRFRQERRLIIQDVTLTLSLLFVGAFVFGGLLPFRLQNYPLAFLCIPLVVLGAFRLRPQEASTAIVALSGIAVWGTLRGIGGFVGQNQNESLLLLQMFMGVVSMTSLLVSAVVLQRNSIQSWLKAARDELETRVEERTAQLQQQIIRTRELSARLLQVQDDERRRIARDLHDSTGQSLAVLTMNLDKLQRDAERIDSGLAQAISNNAELVRQLSKEVRTVSYLLHPPLLDEMGLAAGISWYAEGFRERSNIPVDLHIADKSRRLPHDLELTIFRVVQESLTNIHRHSRSPRATITLNELSGRIILEVQDEGSGISPEILSKIDSVGLPGVGLRGMQERVRGLGGELHISSDEKGTMIKASFPVPPMDITS
jgi:signal transduction histidine kinase